MMKNYGHECPFCKEQQNWTHVYKSLSKHTAFHVVSSFIEYDDWCRDFWWCSTPGTNLTASFDTIIHFGSQFSSSSLLKKHQIKLLLTWNVYHHFSRSAELNTTLKWHFPFTVKLVVDDLFKVLCHSNGLWAHHKSLVDHVFIC